MAYTREKFGKEPKDLRIAIIHEDGAYGVDVAHGNFVFGIIAVGHAGKHPKAGLT